MLGNPCAAVLMCHAPIVIPAIGRGRAGECAATTAAMRGSASHVVQARPETVVVVSPHLPRSAEAFTRAMDALQVVDFRAFGHAELHFALPSDAAAGAALARVAERRGLALTEAAVSLADHGSGVPLWFLHEAGFRGRLLLLGFPWRGTPHGNRLLGQVLAEAMAGLERRWALVASGDLSHALQPGAPAGHHPRAAAFDAALVETLRRGPLEALDHLDPELRRLAAEDAVDSLQVAAGALDPDPACQEVLSYEGPFGVGYAVALLR